MAIELTRTHRHGGRDYPAGAVLRLPRHKADWLLANGVAKNVQPAQDASPAKGPHTKDKE